MKRYIPMKPVARRYSRDPRTIDRWVQEGVFPPPIYIQKRRLWSEEALDAFDAACEAQPHEPKPMPPRALGARHPRRPAHLEEVS
jgi:predicted DNA-binding transcriptional regulator AlpA